ncbi:hypothetical protein [Sphingomonas edaphi]|nr:hypothetical protein [Sphingomonas edaphi]
MSPRLDAVLATLNALIVTAMCLGFLLLLRAFGRLPASFTTFGLSWNS